VKNPVIKISVRDLVQAALNSGDIKFGFLSPSRAQEGIIIHKQVQDSRAEGYQKEVPLRFSLKDADLSLEIQGRIDGVFLKEGITVIEEIKSTRTPVADLQPPADGTHFTQALVYAYIFAEQKQLEKVLIHLTYFQVESGEIRTFERYCAFAELSATFKQITDRFLERTREYYHWLPTRDSSIQKLTFPFPGFRKGQEILIDEVKQAIENRYNLFVQAPTGLGKTLATLFPAIKALEYGKGSQIFYLTARTTTRDAAETALEQLKQNGLRLKSITLTAKEKVCFMAEPHCEPEQCRYIVGYYDRLYEGIRDIFTHDQFTRSRVVEYAEKHCICPFEYSLDLSLLCDCIICDYNYLFDPRVNLARFFKTAGKDYIFLVDEAHNLVERSREMFSAALEKKAFLDLKRMVNSKTDKDLADSLKALNDYLLEARKARQLQNSHFVAEPEVPQQFIDLLEDFLGPAEAILSTSQDKPFRDKLTDLYYRALFFIKIFQMAGQSEAFICTFEQQGSKVQIKLLCLDPSQMIAKATAKGRSTIFFSATLMPESYFFNLFGGVEGIDQAFQIESPFPPENLSINLIDTISTKFRDRHLSYDRIATCLSLFVNQKKGNYLIYFPSFSYLHEVYQRFENIPAGLDLFKQDRFMTEPARDSFLEKFSTNREKSLVSFVVSGGIFGESINLPGERLIGVAIIGVGLPQVNPERDLVRQYFESQSAGGFHYAYTYPGMNRVLQAAGRLIRTTTDRGALLLIDDRFGTNLYRRLYPAGWPAIQTIRDGNQLAGSLQAFWMEQG